MVTPKNWGRICQFVSLFDGPSLVKPIKGQTVADYAVGIFPPADDGDPADRQAGGHADGSLTGVEVLLAVLAHDIPPFLEVHHEGQITRKVIMCNGSRGQAERLQGTPNLVPSVVERCWL